MTHTDNLIVGLLQEAIGDISRLKADISKIAESPADRPEPLLTIDDVAAHLQVSRRTVETLIAEGELGALRIRGTRRFTREAVDAYVRSTASRKARRTA